MSESQTWLSVFGINVFITFIDTWEQTVSVL